MSLNGMTELCLTYKDKPTNEGFIYASRCYDVEVRYKTKEIVVHNRYAYYTTVCCAFPYEGLTSINGWCCSDASKEEIRRYVEDLIAKSKGE